MSAGDSPRESFVLGREAVDNSDRFIYNSTNGNLFYDPDGIGNKNQILIADLANLEDLVAEDIVII